MASVAPFALLSSSYLCFDQDDFLLFFNHCVYVFETLHTSRYLSVCIPHCRIFLADILRTGWLNPEKKREIVLYS